VRLHVLGRDTLVGSVRVDNELGEEEQADIVVGALASHLERLVDDPEQARLLLPQPDDVVGGDVGVLQLEERFGQVLDRLLALPRVPRVDVGPERGDHCDEALAQERHVRLVPRRVHRFAVAQDGIELGGHLSGRAIGVLVVGQGPGDHEAHHEHPAGDDARRERAQRHPVDARSDEDRPRPHDEADDDRGVDGHAIVAEDSAQRHRPTSHRGDSRMVDAAPWGATDRRPQRALIMPSAAMPK
jgi:hypothetical protein